MPHGRAGLRQASGALGASSRRPRRSARPRSRRVALPVVAARVQHHPSRAALLPALLERLGPAEVVADPEPDDYRSPWRTYRACLEDWPAEATHLLVVQDDAIPCRNLLAACELLARPEPVCLYLGGAPARSAALARRTPRPALLAIHPSDWVPVVAVLWSREAAVDLLDWTSSNRLPGDPRPRSDDAVVGRWARQTRQTVLATTPSLVQHPDEERSLVGRRHGAGRIEWRVAHAYIGDDDPLTLDWR